LIVNGEANDFESNDRSDLISVAIQCLGGVDLQTSRLGVLAGGRRLELNGKRHDGCC
jgi:hypothetical protein